jgi:hypothetical protein
MSLFVVVLKYKNVRSGNKKSANQENMEVRRAGGHYIWDLADTQTRSSIASQGATPSSTIIVTGGHGIGDETAVWRVPRCNSGTDHSAVPHHKPPDGKSLLLHSTTHLRSLLSLSTIAAGPGRRMRTYLHLLPRSNPVVWAPGNPPTGKAPKAHQAPIFWLL